MRRILLLFLVWLHACASANDVPLIRGRTFEAAIAKRPACTQDNVLRALKANHASATPFCSTYIHIPGSTIFSSVAGVTATTVTSTITSVVTINSNFPSPLPTYISQYSSSQVSSGCSCLSIPKSTSTGTASDSTVYSYSTTVSTSTATGACATGTLYPGAHALSGQFADAYSFSLTVSTPYDCCQICNSGGQGPFASCVAWAYLGNGNCSSILEGPPFADYMQPPCTHDGLQPGTIYVDKVKYPGDLGGAGQCASKVTIVNG